MYILKQFTECVIYYYSNNETYNITFHGYGIFILLKMSNIVSSFILVYIKLIKNLNLNLLELAYAYMDHLYEAGLLCMYRYSVEIKVN